MRNIIQMGILFALVLIVQGCTSRSDYHDDLKKGNWDKALLVIRPLAEKGDLEAQYRLGWMYHFHQGVPRDYAESIKWMRRSAENGHPDAQSVLGVWYTRGDGVPQDLSEAAKWYRMAAEGGSGAGQYNIGMCYLKGVGVIQDYAEAVKWLNKTANGGFYPAFLPLGLCYQYGLGVPQNSTQAYMWISLAAKFGGPEEKTCFDQLMAKMTPEQRALGQRMVDGWRPMRAPFNELTFMEKVREVLRSFMKLLKIQEA